MNSAAKNLRKPYKFKTEHMKINKNLYEKAELLFYDGKIKTSVLHTLKAIISARHMKWPTIKQLNEIRTRSCARKFAQSNIVSDKTVSRHLQILIKLNIISMETFYVGWCCRNMITLAPELYESVNTSQDIMSRSISSSLSYKERERAKHKIKARTAPDDMALAVATPVTGGSTFQHETIEERRSKKASRIEQMKLLKQQMGL